MTKNKWIIIAVWGLFCHAITMAQPLCRVVQYDEENGVPSNHLTQLLQDEDGFMWFSTWNGLCRYDGYEFKTFKPQVGDGCHMTTDRIRNITLLPSGHILCRVNEEDYYLFDLNNYCFRDLTTEEKAKTSEYEQKYRQSRSLQNAKGYTWTDANGTLWTFTNDGRLTYRVNGNGQETEFQLNKAFNKPTFATIDNNGNLWALDNGSIYKFCTDIERAQRLDIIPKSEVKCMFHDHEGHYWVTTKEDMAIRIYSDNDDHLLGYLGSDGRLHHEYTSFGAAIYCMLESHDGTLWMGAKPQGLLRLRPTKTGNYMIDHFTDLPNTNIYHLKEDRFGRLWAATLGGGIFYTTNPNDQQPHFYVPHHYPKNHAQRTRYLHITKDDILLTATSEGLLVTRLLPQGDNMMFYLHQREPDRKGSLNCSATMDVVQDRQGRFFVSTESGGVNQITTDSLLSPTLTFKHFRDNFHVQPNDIVLSLTPTENGGLIAVGSHLITVIDSNGQGRVIDANIFNAGYRFSEAHPLALNKGRWLFGLMDGAFIMSDKQMTRKTYTPRLVLTRLTIQGNNNWAVQHIDTLTLLPEERNATIHFAAIDYNNSERINYAFRLLNEDGQDDVPWNYIGHDRSAILLDLKPGTYVLEIRSTNADGEWTDNIRTLTIIVQPTFWESVWGRLLIALIICSILSVVGYTLLYIRHIKRKQRETLEQYLALIESNGERDERVEITKKQRDATDPMLKRVMQFVEENISNGDVSIGDMAAAAATSRSGLQRKLKQTMGITPQDLLREARIKHACQLLHTTDKTIAEVAYACGFADPKYFSRSFKQSTGQSPTEFKNASNKVDSLI